MILTDLQASTRSASTRLSSNIDNWLSSRSVVPRRQQTATSPTRSQGTTDGKTNRANSVPRAAMTRHRLKYKAA